MTDPIGTPSYAPRFLVWKLFLAWIPLLWALWFAIARRTWALMVIGAAWLAFLPNGPYLVTDLIHLSGPRGELWRPDCVPSEW